MGRKKKSETISDTTNIRLMSRQARQELECRVCHIETCIVSMEVGSVVCDYCVSLMVGPPELPPQLRPKSGYPRGWHLKMLFISDDGKYFSRGVEVTKEESKLLTRATPVLDPMRQKRKYKKRTPK